jgi:hypothetical protein
MSQPLTRSNRQGMSEGITTLPRVRCPIKQALVEEARKVMADFIAAQGENFEAAMREDCTRVELAQKRLIELGERHDWLMERFQNHISQHGCDAHSSSCIVRRIRSL